MEEFRNDVLKMLYRQLIELKDGVGVVSDNVFDEILKVDDDAPEYAYSLSFKHMLLYDVCKSLGEAIENIERAMRPC